MATGKRKTAGATESEPSSGIVTKARLIEIRDAQRGSQPQLKKRKDPRVGRKRDHHDGIDDFELELLKHGINFEDLLKAAKSHDAGTRTPYAKLAHAVLRWWCSLPLGARKVVWVDPVSGYTERTLPKLSSAEGQDLVSRGLAGGCWVHRRLHLLEARAWARHMLSLTPQQRIEEPVVLGDERLGRPGWDHLTKK